MVHKLLRGVGCLAYLGMLLVLFATISYVAFSQFVRRGVTPTPELLGLDEEEAGALLADQGLRLEWSDEGDRYDEEVPASHVLMQRPRAGTLVKRGVAVTVILSRGPQLIETPVVTGEALSAAQVTLVAARLRLGRTLSIYSDQGAVGTVVAQHPTGGSRVEPNAQVDVFLSLGSSRQTYVMPDLVTLSYRRVRPLFEAAGFRFGRVSYDDTYAKTASGPGTIVRQFQPRAGQPLSPNDVIALQIVTPTPPAAAWTPAEDGAEEASPSP